jgi:hypothetical protein
MTAVSVSIPLGQSIFVAATFPNLISWPFNWYSPVMRLHPPEPENRGASDWSVSDGDADPPDPTIALVPRCVSFQGAP